MDGLNIVIIILLILVIFWIINNWLLKSDILMDIMCDCSKTPDSSAFSLIRSPGFTDHIKNSTHTNPYLIHNDKYDEALTSNFSITVWFYIYLWDKTSKFKNILFLAKDERQNYADDNDSSTGLPVGTTGELSNFECINDLTTRNIKNLAIFLDKEQNNLYIDILTNQNPSICATANAIYTRYLIKNIDIQKWNCLSISIDTTTLDIYLDGKLLNSFVMNGTYLVTENNSTKQHMFIGSADAGSGNNGTEWNGIVTRIRYNNHSINPEEAYSIYKEGINSSLANSLLNKYGVKVQFLEYNKPRGEFTI